MKYPHDIRKKINAHEEKISTLGTKELLEYSRSLHYEKDIAVDIKVLLFKAIDIRTKYLNSQSEVKKKCSDSDMIKKFKQKAKR